ncbi:MAG: hypothetical protein Q8R36_03530 [bacterium]|nr:hypothetical protein [bacterium]
MAKYNKLNMGQKEAVVNIIGGMERVKMLLGGELLVLSLAELIVWRTVVIRKGTDYWRELYGPTKHTGEAYKMTQNIPTVQEDRVVDLVLLALEDMGFSNPNSSYGYGEICDKAKLLGFHLCPQEVGAHFSTKVQTFCPRKMFYVSSKPLTNGCNQASIYTVHDDGKDITVGSIPTKNARFKSKDLFVFERRLSNG